jgi:hypothetical protein
MGPQEIGLEPVPPEWLARHQLYELWNAGGVEAMIRERWDPQIVWHDPPEFPDPATTRGAAELAEHLRIRLDAVGSVTIALQDAWWVREPELMLTRLFMDSSEQSRGAQLSGVQLFHILRFGDGDRVTEVWEFMHEPAALAAAAAQRATVM